MTSLGLEADAEAARAKNLFGVSSVSYPDAAQIQRIRAGGVRSLRVQLYWGHVEPSPGMRQWAELDRVVADAAVTGVTLVPFLFGTPPWLTSNPATPPLYSPRARDAWHAFVVDLVNRYGPNGEFWSLRSDLPRRPVRHYQLWNEVNLGIFWGSAPDPRAYGDFVKLTGRALGDADRRAELVAAGLIPFKSVGGGSVAGPRYLRRLLKVNGVRKHLDAVAIHPYGRTPSRVVEALEDVRKLLNSRKAGSLPLWATEFGWSTGGADWSASPLKATPTQQAHWVRRTYQLLRKSRRELRLRRAFYYSLADYNLPNGGNSWITRMGLFDVNFQPKPAWFAYVRQAGGTP
jgi:hypothetical protein